MIMEQGRDLIKTTTAITPITAGEGDDKLFAFSEILEKMAARDKKFVIPLLKKIELNTSLLKKFNSPVSDSDPRGRAVIATGTITRTAPLTGGGKSRFPRTERTPVSVPGSPVPQPTPTATARRVKAESVISESQAKNVSTAPVVKPEVAVPEKQNETTKTPVPNKAKPVAANLSEEARGRTARKDVQAPSSALPVESVRDKGGRFTGKSKSQEAKAEQSDKVERKSILKTLKQGFDGAVGKGGDTLAANAGTLEEAAGKAAGGPMFEAAMELKDAFDSARDENSMIGKTARWIGKKTGITKEKTVEAKKVTGEDNRDGKGRFSLPTDDTDEIIKTLNKSETEDDKRHEELIKAIMKGSKPGGKGDGKGRTTGTTARRVSRGEKLTKGSDTGTPSPRKTGPGARAAAKERKALKNKSKTQVIPQKTPGMPGGSGGILEGFSGGAMSGIFKAAMPYLATALPIVLPLVAGAALAYMFKSGYDQLPEKEKEKRKDMADHPGGPHANAQKGEAVDPKTGKVIPVNDSVAQFVGRQEGGSKKYSAVNLNDTGGTVAAGQYQFNSKGELPRFLRTKDKEGKINAEKFGIIADPKKDPQGFKKQWEAAASGEKKAEFEKAQDTHFESAIAKSAMGRAQLAGVNVEDVGTQKILASMATTTGPDGNRKIINKAVEAGGGNDVFKKLSPEQQQNLIVEQRKNYVQNPKNTPEMTQIGRQQAVERYDREKKEVQAGATTAGAAKPIDKVTIPSPIPAAKPPENFGISKTAAPAAPTVVARKAETPLADAVNPVKAATAQPAYQNKGEGMFVDGGPITTAKPMPGLNPPVTPLATSVAPRPSPPERIQPISESQAKATGTTSGAGAASIPGMDKLIAMMTKQASGKDDATAGQSGQQIRTEFDDTMLTLMAYDRV